MRKPAFFLIACCLLAWGGYALYHHIYYRYLLTDMELSYALEEETRKPPPLPADFDKMVNQTYTYLGQGAHAYAFASGDGNYVLKVFHYKHANKPHKREKVLRCLQGYATSLEKIPRESAILYQQLTPGMGPQATVKLYDRLGFPHHIHLQDVRYVFQKRVTPVSERLSDPAFKARVYDFVEKERLLGLYDKDLGLSHNLGYSGDDIYHIDLGDIVYDPEFCCSAAFAGHCARIQKRMAAKGF